MTILSPIDDLPEIDPLPDSWIREDWVELSKSGDASSDEGRTLIKATPFIWADPSSIPARRWIYGSHYIRKFLSTTVAPGGVGKSSLNIAEAIAIATGKPLLGIKPDERTKVWLWNGEDPAEELQRRIMAATMHYGVQRQELENWLFVDSGRQTEIIIAEQTRQGVTINAPMIEAIKHEIIRKQIGLLIIDPFISSHRVTENDNNAIERVAKSWAQIADETGCSIELVHHSRKTGGVEVTVEDGRGAVALLAAARSARVLNPMTKEEAEKAGVENHRLFFRVDNGKANLVVPLDRAVWHRLASVSLGNGANSQGGDSVGVATSWEWPNPFDQVTVANLRAAQKAVSEGGPWRENNQASEWVVKPIAQAMRLDPDTKSDKRKIAGLLKVWIDQGMFVRVTGKDSKRMEKTFVEVGQWAAD